MSTQRPTLVPTLYPTLYRTDQYRRGLVGPSRFRRPDTIPNLTGWYSPTRGLIANGSRDFEQANSQHYQIADDPALRTGPIDFAFLAWVKFESSGTRAIGSKRSATEPEWQLWLDGLRLNWGLWGPGLQQLIGLIDIVPGDWHFVGGWQDIGNNEMGLFVDARLPSRQPLSVTVAADTAPMWIGSEGTGSAFDMDGNIQNAILCKPPTPIGDLLWAPGGIHDTFFSAGNVPDLAAIASSGLFTTFGVELAAPLNGRQTNEIDLSPNDFELVASASAPISDNGKAADEAKNINAANNAPWRVIDEQSQGNLALDEITGINDLRSTFRPPGRTTGRSLRIRATTFCNGGDHFPGDGAHTLACWLYNELDTQGDLISRFNGSGSYLLGTAGFAAGQYKIRGHVVGDTGIQSLDSTAVVNTNEWVHAMQTYEQLSGSQSRLKLYVNGIPSGEILSDKIIRPTTAIDFHVGARATGPFGGQGYLYEPAVYDFAADDAQALAIYGGTGPAPVSRWMFDEGNWIPGMVSKAPADQNEDACYTSSPEDPATDYYFSGRATSRHIDWQDSPEYQPTAGLTVAAFVVLNDVGAWNEIVNKGRGTTLGVELGINPSGLMHFLLSNDGVGWQFSFVASHAPLAGGQRYHIAVTYDYDVARYYIDGALVTTSPSNNLGGLPIVDNGEPWRFGEFVLSGVFWNGKQGQQKIYTHKLEDAEIATLAAGGSVPGAIIEGIVDQHFAPSGTNVQVGGPVSRWEDQSAERNHVSEFGVTSRPTWIDSIAEFGGRPGVRFDGVDDLMVSIRRLAQVNGLTVVIKVVLRVNDPGRRFIDHGNAHVETGWLIEMAAITNAMKIRGDVGEAPFAFDTVGTNEQAIYTMLSDLASDHKAWRNLASLLGSTTNTGSISAERPLALSGNITHFDVGDIAIYDRQLETEELEGLWRWFGLDVP